MKGTVFSGMRPTGRLHIGHLSVLKNWVALQQDYQCYFGVVDWHALTTSFDETDIIRDNVNEMVLDWLAVGLDPEVSPVFVQSMVKEHAELHLLLSMITPVSWLERCPTYKDQIIQLGEAGKDISMYGFLGYPVLMASDILVYQADTVPVGKDQLPHLELTREIARRFNYLYQTDLLPEPKAYLPKLPVLPGVDGRKMSKSYHNDINLTATPEELLTKVKMMVTDPGRIHKNDPGNPDICTVYAYHTVFNEAEQAAVEADCRAGNIGCVACKKRLASKLDEELAPIRERRVYLSQRPELVQQIVEDGASRARQAAGNTMKLVREAMKI
ncbi:MAG: tryptophan--tRNA ligase [Methylocystaceae bacterium]